ncbi:hypothetical protein W97_07033 [Coniosporium apollinis CBS 100218]|uniref:Uncharacterized protein n=1 Tax=Coniosporium apollinis (strain CBS 100218) TaxID=1168221 RepID=R7Z112_CONA1|nr:uncharacterized protein W97_07033 [Coniosporium apollinis CBS 100218]EON67778.1 hypothetical protein W97_07033 [Coniosporium apollinis CBS 100218]
MCIAVFSTAHPEYPFILISNRDEYLGRPTHVASWWSSPNEHVLGGWDLHRAAHGTWLGVTRQGRIAVLTNFREEDQAIVEGKKSRGAIVNSFLLSPPDSDESTEEFAKRLVEEDGVQGVGGFSLLFGKLQDVIRRGGEGNEPTKKKGLAIVSNRTPDVEGLIWVCGERDETHALSNSWYGDRSWPKVVQGEEELKSAIDESVQKGESQNALIKRLFHVLSIDTLPKKKHGEEWETYIRELRNSIFIPPVGGDELNGKSADEVAAAKSQQRIEVTSGIYGTQKQTVVLCDSQGKVTYVERTRTDEEGDPIEVGKGDRRFDLQIDQWQERVGK